jgi:uncharacterized protein
MSNDLGPLARTLAKPYYERALPAHDRFHANRVRDLAIQLANECEQPVDRDVLSAAAWLHDIGRPLERVGDIDDHDSWAASEVEDLLESEGVGAERIEAIQDCIRSHSIRASSPAPETIEAKLLFDADKLDAVGARGIVRLACIVGERSGRTGERFAVIEDESRTAMEPSDLPDVSVLQKWAAERLETLYTDAGRRLGESRMSFMDTFFQQFTGEIGGNGET